MSPSVREYRIHADLADRVRETVDKVNRRLTRLHLPPYQVSITELDPVPVYDDFHSDVTVVDGVPHRDGQPCRILSYEVLIHVVVTGDPPRLADWEPVAVLTREQGGPVITRVWPGLAQEPNLAAFRGTDPVCEHCHTARDRNDTFVVRHTRTGQMRQVGRNCLAAYTGVRLNIPTWLYTHGGLDDLDALCGSSCGGSPRAAVDEILAVTVAAIREAGWVSRTLARESMGVRTATADLVDLYVWGRSTSAAKLREQWQPVVHHPDTITRTAAIRDYATHLADHQDGEYAANLSTLAALDYVTPRNVGLLCSAAAAYARHEEREVQRRVEGESQRQGAVKQRLNLDGLTVTHTNVIDTAWGLSTLIVLVDQAGNRFKWFASGLHTFDVGDRVSLRGTVKTHDEYHGIQQTQLTRCTVTHHTKHGDEQEGEGVGGDPATHPLPAA
jgi:hypothetical protein